MPSIASEAIAQVEYDTSTHTLFVRFAHGQWYAYLDVPHPTYQRLLAAESKGRVFQETVRNR